MRFPSGPPPLRKKLLKVPGAELITIPACTLHHRSSGWTLCGSSSSNIYNIWLCETPHTHSVNTAPVCVCVCRLQQLDRHCQSSAQQVCELLAKQSQLMQERRVFTEELRSHQVEVTLGLRPAAADVAAHR